MIRATSAALLLFLVTATGAVAWLAYDAHRLLMDVDRLTPAANLLVERWTPTAGKPNALIDAAYNLLHATNDNLNRGCGGGRPCGTLATLNKAAAKIGDSVVTTQLAERATVPHVLKTMDSLNDAAVKLGGTAEAATATLGTAQATIAQAQPILTGLKRNTDDLDELLRDHAIAATLANMERMTASGDGILADARKVADKETADWLKPRPWWQAPIAKGGALIDITAAIARHTP